MESNSSIRRIVGSISEEKREGLVHAMDEVFTNQDFEQLSKYEREKTQEELEIIEIVNQATNDLLEKYELPPFTIPAKNIHMLNNREEVVQGHDMYIPRYQAIFIRDKKSKVDLSRSLFHEVIHFKSYTSMQVTTDESNFDVYRRGITTHSRDGKNIYLNNINEAVTEEMTQIFIRQLSEHPLFKEDIQKSDELIRNFIHGDQDVYYIEINENEDAPEKEHWRANLSRAGYVSEREVLRTLIDKIYSKNEEKFNSRDEVLDMFSRSMITGNLISLTRIIENTFGEGTFRVIAELDKDVEKQKEFVGSL